MKQKISIPVLLLIAVCALAAVALIQRALSHRNASVRTETAGLLPKFQADDVARFRLSWRGMTATLAKDKNGVWTVEERALPADPKKVLEFLETAASIRPLKLIAPADEKTLLRLRTFVQGSSIELSADGPIKPPYAVYFQGGLTWYHAKLGILMSLQKLKERNLVNTDLLC